MAELHRPERGLLREVQQLDRYAKQISFGPIGLQGQARLAEARVLIVGVGALGSHSATSLVRAGVGHIDLVDRDIVELGNLQRQVLFDEEDAKQGRPKADAAAERLASFNSSCQVRAMVEDLDRWSIREIQTLPDLIIDGTDNFATRYLINDFAQSKGIPWIYAGGVGASGRAMAILPGESACLRCLLPQAAPAGELASCETDGILEPLIAQLSAFQVTECLKILSGNRDKVARGILTVDVWENEYELKLRGLSPSADCPACARQEYPALKDEPIRSMSLCGRDGVQIKPPAGASIDLGRLAARIASIVENLEEGPHLLRFTAEQCRFHVFPGGRALVMGTSEEARARSLYDRYVGIS